MAHVSYVSTVAEDLDGLTGFYADTFGFEPIDRWTTPIFRALDAGHGLILGFHAPEAYELLGLESYSPAAGARQFVTFAAPDATSVDALTERAVRRGARLVTPAFVTYYNAYQAVLADPEDNPFRINVHLD